jgi:hypothetical protein
MNYEKLESLARTPRAIDARLLKIHRKPFFFLKRAIREWRDGLTNGPLVYAFVVQADLLLYEQGLGATAPAVLLYTEDPRYCRDVAWLTDLGERVTDLRIACSEEPALRALGCLLNSPHSEFDLEIPRAFSGGVTCRLYTAHLSAYKLPGACIAEPRIVPLLVLAKDHTAVVPAELYD